MVACLSGSAAFCQCAMPASNLKQLWTMEASSTTRDGMLQHACGRSNQTHSNLLHWSISKNISKGGVRARLTIDQRMEKQGHIGRGTSTRYTPEVPWVPGVGTPLGSRLCSITFYYLPGMEFANDSTVLPIVWWEVFIEVRGYKTSTKQTILYNNTQTTRVYENTCNLEGVLLQHWWL